MTLLSTLSLSPHKCMRGRLKQSTIPVSWGPCWQTRYPPIQSQRLQSNTSAITLSHNPSTPQLSPFHITSPPLHPPPTPTKRKKRVEKKNKDSPKTLLAGIGPIPRLPYAQSGWIVNFLASPGHMSNNPWSQPLMTWPFPTWKVRGWPRLYEASNSVPSEARLPR